MERLMAYLEHIPEGEIDDIGELDELLAECWDEFSGDDGGMRPDKHLDRMEEVVWRPPILEFVIERHGGFLMGSSRAELQHWTLDVEKKTVHLQKGRHRQMYPRQAPVNVKPIADELAKLITEGKCDDRLKWSKAGRVQVRMGRIFPADSAAKETVTGRGKRLNAELEKRLALLGWIRMREWWQKE